MPRIATDEQVHMRWLTERDLADVLAVEQASFGAASWGEEDLRSAARDRRIILLVAETGTTIVGHVVYLLEARRLRVLRLAVHPNWRRAGVGSRMVRKLQSKLHAPRRNRIVVDLWDTNLEGHLFLRANGFEAVRVLRDFPEADAYRFVYRLRGAT